MVVKQHLDPNGCTKLIFGGLIPKRKKLITVCIHGDETCGLTAVNELIDEGFFENGFDIQNQRATIVLGNPKAVQDHKRFVDINLNRIFTPQFLEHKMNRDMVSSKHYELPRVMEIGPEIRECDEYLDLHSTSASTEPFAIVLPDNESENIAKMFPVKFILHNVNKIICGTTLDYALELHKTGCCVECGQHNCRRSVDIAKQTIRTFLSPSHEDHSSKEVLFVEKAEILRKGFKFCMDAKAFEKVQFNELVAVDDEVGELRCPYKGGAFLIMPIANPIEGEEAWLWGHNS